MKRRHGGDDVVSGFVAMVCAIGSGLILLIIGLMLLYYFRARKRERRPDDVFVAYLHEHARSFCVGVPADEVDEANVARIERRRRRIARINAHPSPDEVVIAVDVVASPHATPTAVPSPTSTSSTTSSVGDVDVAPWEINEAALEANLPNHLFMHLFGNEPHMWQVAMGRFAHQNTEAHQQHLHAEEEEVLGDVDLRPHPHTARMKVMYQHASSHHIRLPSQDIYGHASYNARAGEVSGFSNSPMHVDDHEVWIHEG